MSKFFKRVGGVAILLFFIYWQFLRNKQLVNGIAHMNYELDKANDHIFALTIECDNLIGQTIDQIIQIETLGNDLGELSEFVHEMALLNAVGFYQQVAYVKEGDDVSEILFTKYMAHIKSGHNN